MLNVIAWALIIFGVLLLLWKVFGNSPDDYYVLIALMSGTLFKVWTMSNSMSELKGKLSADIPSIKNRLEKLEKKRI